MTDAFKPHDTESTTLSWPLHADHPAIADRLRDQIAAGGFAGVIVLTDPATAPTISRRSVVPTSSIMWCESPANCRKLWAKRPGCVSLPGMLSGAVR